MKGYSKVLVPPFSVDFTSYTSKSGGKATLGASKRAILPLPEMVTMSDAASWVLRESRVSDAFMENLPTPPPNEAGAPAGRAFTLIVRAEVRTLLRMVRYSSWKKESKMLPLRAEVLRTFTRHTSSAGSTLISPAL